MDIQSLRTLQTVAQHGSLAAAARALDLDPSSVSRTISNLEAELGLRLFQRSTRRLSITEAGQIYLERMTLAIEALDEAQELAIGAVVGPEGQVRIAASVAFGNEVLVPMLGKLRTALPNIAPELLLSDDPVDLVGAGVDLAIRLAPAPSGDLISARLLKTSYNVVAAPEYLSRSGRPESPQHLSHHDCLRLTLPDFRSEWIFRHSDKDQRVTVSGSITISNPLALREAARNALGPALLADWLVRDDIATGRLIDLFPLLQVTATTFDTGAWLLYPSRRFLPHRIRAVIDFLRAELPKSK